MFLFNKMYKQVILVRQDLKMPKGKMAAQVSHASVDATLKSKSGIVNEWRNYGAKKIILNVTDEKELLNYMKIAQNQGIVTSLIKDAGHTVLEKGTVTCLGIGPDKEDLIDKITGKLKMV